jgi:ATP/maltotriose-dependent transcriptional regulator MalT
MKMPLLQTKLHIPPLRTELVSRTRLTDRLGILQNRKLSVISAPAGFGKSTLVSCWLAQQNRPVAWVSLDENDNDPASFFPMPPLHSTKLRLILGQMYWQCLMLLIFLPTMPCWPI